MGAEGRLADPVLAPFTRAAEIGARRGFFRDAEFASAMYRAGSDALLVSFCNLASFEHPPEARLPWLYPRAEARGWSHLGIMAKRKDWYRNPSAPALLGELAGEGFFGQFRRVVFTGTSMGGFAALTFVSLAPGSDVLAFSPQSTLNTAIAPFERRYRWPRRKFDWTDPAYLDAAEHVGAARRAVVLHDPMVAPDRAHVARLGGPPVEPVACRFMGHMLPNGLKRAGVLDLCFDMAMGEGFDRARFYAAFRAGRRQMTTWRKAMVEHAVARGRPARAIAICDRVLAEGPGPWFRRTRAGLIGEGSA